MQAPPGGYLAYMQGYNLHPYPRDVQPASGQDNSTTTLAGPSILQLQLVWAVPANFTTPHPSDGLYGSGGVRTVGPSLMPVVPDTRCSDARELLPAGLPRAGAECGLYSPEGYSCPSYMCCGTARGHVGTCGVGPSQCMVSLSGHS